MEKPNRRGHNKGNPQNIKKQRTGEDVTPLEQIIENGIAITLCPHALGKRRAAAEEYTLSRITTKAR